MFLSRLLHLALVCLPACAVAADEPERGDGLAVHPEHPRELPLRGLRDPE